MNRRRFNLLSLSTAAGCIASPFIPLFDMEEEPTFLKIKNIPKTDTHVHLFNLDLLNYPWLQNAQAIRKNFFPADFIEATRRSDIGKIVFMECGAEPESSMKEVRWAMEQAASDSRIKGIVAGGQIVPGGAIDPPIEELVATGWVKGIRGTTEPDVLASPDFMRAMKLLASHNLSCDLLIRPASFQVAAKAISKTEDTIFILDHLGLPDIKGRDFDTWKKGIDELARHPNLYCKISGLLTLAGKNWTQDMIKPYLHYAVERFGFDRIVYGGDWPVVLLADSYWAWSNVFEKLTRSFSKEDLRKLYHLNADRIYRLGD